MSVTAASPPSTAAPAASDTPAAGSQDLGEDAFLRLLTVQLQNQDPTDPMKSDQFVAQLAQFSSLEQLISMQKSMDAVYLAVASMNNASMATLLGTEVVAVGDTFAYDGEGGTTLQFDASAPIASGTVTITDEDGRVVATIDMGATAEGEGEIFWDGTGIDGSALPPGEYSFSIDAKGSDGEPVEVTTLVSGTVTSMDYSTGVPQPSIDGIPVDLASVLTLTAGEP